jgi:hypothetical protein
VTAFGQPLGSLWTMNKEGDEQRLNNEQRQPLDSFWTTNKDSLFIRLCTPYSWTKTAFLSSVHTVQWLLCTYWSVFMPNSP